ncbi:MULTISPECIES: hypothetical protein [unclassified Nocardia]|uniref:hypothetical protein n=1 Tax=unclassified Nocardia TaxID=2637762 RepID=UPI001CE42442|nr:MULTISPECIES: hypothetical protein [unclassified Nocardia]
MTLLAGAAVAALICLLLWRIGAFLARILGAGLVIVALAALATGGSALTWSVLAVVGGVSWLLGHTLSAFKARRWESRLAETLISRTFLAFLDPVGRRKPKSEPKRDAEKPVRRRETAEPEPEAEPVAAPDDFEMWERELTAERSSRRRIRRAES